MVRGSVCGVKGTLGFTNRSSLQVVVMTITGFTNENFREFYGVGGGVVFCFSFDFFLN